jgi:hypothetical protein
LEKSGRGDFQSLEMTAAVAIVSGMAFIADTHVHLYPFHDIATALGGAMERLGKLAPGLPRVLCLTERGDCRFFRSRRELPESTRELAAASGLFQTVIPLPPPFSSVSAGPDALAITDNAGGKLFIIAGRQIATSERLEVSCLTVDANIPDGITLADAVVRVREAGGVAAIPWGVGKWLGARGKIVREILGRNPDVLAGDSSLRPLFWPEPVFRATAGRVVAGSDPLPAPGEEKQVGGYSTIFDAPFDENDPAGSVRAALRTGPGFRIVGRRGCPVEVWLRLRAMKKAAR